MAEEHKTPAGSAPTFFGRECLDALTGKARQSPRRRMNLNFHGVASHPAQRLLNAMEPDSYVRPHRHLEPLKEETFVAVRGAFGIVLFDEAGAVTEHALIGVKGELVGGNVPGGVFHTILALEPGSVFFEAKAGPYVPLTDKDFAPWAPRESDPEVPQYLARLRSLFP